MRSHSLIGWGGVAAAAVLLHASVAWADSNDVTALSPDQAVALALAAHPTLRTAENARSSARAARSASSPFLANPTAETWLTPDASRGELSIGQPVSLSGEGWHARSAARSSIVASEATLSRTRREVAATVRLAYIDAAVAIGVVDVAQEGLELAARLSFAVTRKHEEGEASTLDLRLARLTEVQAAARLLEARRDESHALRQLSAWVLTPVTAEAVAIDPMAAAPAIDADPSGTRADVAAAEAELMSAQAGLRRARAAVLPPITVGVGAEFEGGSTFIGPSIGLTLPLFDRNQIGRARAAGAVHTAEGRLEATKARAQTERHTSSVRATEADAAAASVASADQDEARAALASIEAGVLAGEIDLSTAILLQTQVLDGEAAIVTLRGLVAEARVDRQLALDQDALLGSR
jgi:outer membrane protein TolC